MLPVPFFRQEIKINHVRGLNDNDWEKKFGRLEDKKKRLKH